MPCSSPCVAGKKQPGKATAAPNFYFIVKHIIFVVAVAPFSSVRVFEIVNFIFRYNTLGDNFFFLLLHSPSFTSYAILLPLNSEPKQRKIPLSMCMANGMHSILFLLLSTDRGGCVLPVCVRARRVKVNLKMNSMCTLDNVGNKATTNRPSNTWKTRKRETVFSLLLPPPLLFYEPNGEKKWKVLSCFIILHAGKRERGEKLGKRWGRL